MTFQSRFCYFLQNNKWQIQDTESVVALEIQQGKRILI